MGVTVIIKLRLLGCGVGVVVGVKIGIVVVNPSCFASITALVRLFCKVVFLVSEVPRGYGQFCKKYVSILFLRISPRLFVTLSRTKLM